MSTKKAKSVWVQLGSYATKLQELTDFINSPIGNEAGFAILVGPTGSGKTCLLDGLLPEELVAPQETDDGTMRPVIRFEAPDTPTSKSISQTFLRTQGDPNWEKDARKHQNVLMDRVFNYLRGQKTKLIVIDEAQGLLARTGTYSASDFVKRILNQGASQLILSGLPNLLELLTNQQLATRCSLIIELYAFDWFNAAHQLEYRQLLKGLQDRIPALQSTVDLSSKPLARGIIYSCYGVLRETRQFLDETVRVANGAPITLQHLAQAFDNRAHQRKALGKDKRINPFIPGNQLPTTFSPADFSTGVQSKKKAA